MREIPALLKNVDTIIWDYNGTLLNDVAICVDAINSMLLERGIKPVTISEYQEVFDFPVKDYYEKIGFDFSKEDFAVVGREFIHRYDALRPNSQLQPNVRNTLSCFRDRGVRQFVLSAREEESLKREMRDFQLDPFFEAIYGLGDHYAHGKVDLGLELMQDFKLNPSKTVMIGDTLHDAEVAQEMGIMPILITHGHHHASRLAILDVLLIDSLDSLCKEFAPN